MPVLDVVQRVLERRLLDAAGLVAGEGQGGAVTLIQRFGSAANLNVHLHCLGYPGSCDHIPRRSWEIFRARDVMRGVIESFREEHCT